MTSMSIENLIYFLERLANVVVGTPDEKFIRSVLAKDIECTDLMEVIGRVNKILKQQARFDLSATEIIDLIDSGKAHLIRDEASKSLKAASLLEEWCCS